jgi:peptide/nickel transport system substrate-binding protein
LSRARVDGQQRRNAEDRAGHGLEYRRHLDFRSRPGEVVTGEILQNTCDSLADFDPVDERKVIPLFAESWTVSPDRKTITFKVRKGAKFPSGNIATAQDVALGMRRVVKLGFGNSTTLTEFGFSKDNVEQRIVAPDDTTLVLTFDKAYPTTLVLQAIAANRVRWT